MRKQRPAASATGAWPRSPLDCLVVGVLMLAQGLLTQGADPAYPLLLSVKNR